MNISQAECRFLIPGFFVSEAETNWAYITNLLDVGDMTEMLTGEKEKGNQREAVQQSRKSRFPDDSDTRHRVSRTN